VFLCYGLRTFLGTDTGLPEAILLVQSSLPALQGFAIYFLLGNLGAGAYTLRGGFWALSICPLG